MVEERRIHGRLLSRQPAYPVAREHRIFRYHYLLGADWKLCCRKMKIERGAFFHEVYRIEQKLGRTFRELEPHALFPVDEYFNGTGRYEPVIARDVQPVRCGRRGGGRQVYG